MRPFILTELQAGKLPRWGLILLCALYVLPGLLGRDPWRVADAADFGVSFTLARGALADWLLPNLAGEPSFDRGPLSFWLAAAPSRILYFVPEHLVVRMVAALGLALMLSSFWYAAYLLSRRAGVQPSDPFGVSASQVDYGRALADSGLLILIATFGLLIRLHETTAAAAQVVCMAVFLLGAALALERPRRGGMITGVAIAALGLCKSWPNSLVLILCLIILCLFSQPYRIIARPFLIRVIAITLVLMSVWPIVLYLLGGPYIAYLQRWLMTPLGSLGSPNADSLTYFMRTIPWFFWPAWPVAAWALYRWRSRLGEPAVALPFVSLAGLTLLALAGNSANEAALLPMAAPLALLAAIGLPTLRRGVVSLIDWFSVTTFTLFGLVVWAYWIALVSGVPAKMAYRASQLANGTKPGIVIAELLLGLAASLAWLLLVRWRISRQPPMIWRAVVLSSAGLVLAWFLLMTLWLPVFNQRNTYRDLAERLAAELPAQYDCVETREVPPAERASLLYFGQLRFAAHAPDFLKRSCSFLVIHDEGPISQSIRPNEAGWNLLWEGRRPNDPLQRLRLYGRQEDRDGINQTKRGRR
jgi:4-amino-4-deoxy-L-arabinose transferase-like glycosyltransferase